MPRARDATKDPARKLPLSARPGWEHPVSLTGIPEQTGSPRALGEPGLSRSPPHHVESPQEGEAGPGPEPPSQDHGSRLTFQGFISLP